MHTPNSDGDGPRRLLRAALVGVVAAAVAFVGAATVSSALSGNSTEPEVEEGRSLNLRDTYNRSVGVEPTGERPGDAAMETLLDEVAATGLVPVAQPQGGFVPVEALEVDHVASSREDLIPVVDSDGEVIAYWGVGLGPVDLDLVESGAPLDMDEIRATNQVSVTPPEGFPGGQ